MHLFGHTKDDKQDESAAAEAAPKAQVRIDGAVYALESMDRKHLLLSDYDGDLIRHQRFQFAFLLPLGDETVEAPTSGVVLKVGNNRLLARYHAPQPYYQKLMRKAADSLPMQPG